MKNNVLLRRITALAASCVMAASLFPVSVYAAGTASTSVNLTTNTASAPDTSVDATVKSNVFTISSKEDLFSLAEKCRTEGWSSDTQVELTCDIELGEDDIFVGLYSFSGVFNGNNHTISGILANTSLSSAGFIRYLEYGAVVKNLKVEARFYSDNSSCIIGGIAGVNAGTIQNCTFNGYISAEGITGGIAGQNASMATITGCKANGIIDSQKYVGGIAGRNLGVISDCTNYISVNADSDWVDEDTSGSSSFSLDSLFSTAETVISNGRNIGGIAGYSSGMISGCTNEAEVGYEHAGRNVGGIVGYQAGIVLQCENLGTIKGKTNVGGIAGLFVPNITIQDKAQLKTSITELHDAIAKTISDAHALGQGVDSQLEGLQKSADSAVSSAGVMLDETVKTVNYDITAVNDLMSRASYVSNRIVNIFDYIDDALSSIDALSDDVGEIGQDLAGQEISGNTDLADAMAQLNGDVSTLQTSSADIRSSAEQIKAILHSGEDGSIDLTALSDEDLEKIGELLEKIEADIETIRSSISITVNALQTVMEYLADYSGDIAQTIQKISEHLQKAGTDLNTFTSALENAGTETKSIFEYLNGLDDIQIQGLSQEFSDSSDSLKSSLNDVSDYITALRASVSSGSATLEADFTKVNDILENIFNIILDRLSALENVTETLDLMEDTSADDSDSSAYTRITSCKNSGIVEGNANVGGIAGTMDVEGGVSDDETSLNLTTKYLVRARIDDSTNTGLITAKNNYVGGIVGYMELGLVKGCISSGSATSSSGGHVGGIAGISEGTIMNCSSMTELNGDDYLGGIAGTGNVVSGCYSMAYIGDGYSRKGAILGCDEPEDDEELSVYRINLKSRVHDNYFVSSTLYGIDSVNYAGVAEALTYDELISREDVPDVFRHLTITYLDEDNNIVKTTEMPYGSSLEALEYPLIDSGSDTYSEWWGIQSQTLESNLILRAHAMKNVTVIASEEKVDDKDAALASGIFTDTAVFNAEEVTDAPTVTTEKNATVSVRKLTLTGTKVDDSTTTKVRLYAGKNAESAVVYELVDGSWVKQSSTCQGQYVQAEMTGTSQTFAVVTTSSQNSMLIYIAAAAAAVVAVILVIIFIVRKNRKNGKSRRMA